MEEGPRKVLRNAAYLLMADSYLATTLLLPHERLGKRSKSDSNQEWKN